MVTSDPQGSDAARTIPCRYDLWISRESVTVVHVSIFHLMLPTLAYGKYLGGIANQEVCVWVKMLVPSQ